jgi:hypothetical protein
MELQDIGDVLRDRVADPVTADDEVFSSVLDSILPSYSMKTLLQSCFPVEYSENRG